MCRDGGTNSTHCKSLLEGRCRRGGAVTCSRQAPHPELITSRYWPFCSLSTVVPSPS